MSKKRQYIRTCEECGNPHTMCKEDNDGLMVCGDCQEHGTVRQDVDEVTQRITTRKAINPNTKGA